MSVSLPEIIDAIADVWEGKNGQPGIAGVERVWRRLPDAIGSALPAVILEPAEGTLDFPRGMSLRKAFHDVRMVLCVSSSEAPSASNAVWPFVNTVFDAFDQAVTLGGAVAGSTITAYKTGRVAYNGATYYGVTFTIKVRVSEAIAYKP